MTETLEYNTDIVVIGGGIAGITLALDLLERGEKRRITIVDSQEEEKFGGLAKSAFGGMMFVDTPAQRKSGIKDSSELALSDWHNFAEFGPEDYWPRMWAKYYVEHVTKVVHDWIKAKNIKFLPAIQWVERGLYQPGNSVPRYHILSGTSQYLMERLIDCLRDRGGDQISYLFNHSVQDFDINARKMTRISGQKVDTKQSFTLSADIMVLATGGVSGNLDKVRENWPKDWSRNRTNPKDLILNGSHPSADGHMHDQVTKRGGQVTHLDKMWNYASGIAHPHPKFSGHGLSLVPTRSSLWMNHKGRRIGPVPLVTGFDTRYLCEQVAKQEKPWTWQIMNWKIARRELAISGAEHNPDLRKRNLLLMIFKLLTAHDGLVHQMVEQSEDFIIADTLGELATKMNQLTGKNHISATELEQQILQYDDQIARGPKFHNDDQLRRLQQLRQWMGDRIRTCKFQRILDSKAGPLLAIRTHLISRKTLGGMQTNLDCQLLHKDGDPFDNIFAIGEAAGFGGGGASGKRSLEGTFLSGCILTARKAAETIYNHFNRE